MRSRSRFIPLLCLMLALGIAAGCSKARNDSQLQSDVQSKIYSDPQVQSRQITVDSKDGVVTLSGYTNSDAERALRHGVIYRKLSGGTDSEAGSRFVERMLSVVATCRQQEVNVLDYLTRCYQARLDGKVAPSLLPTTSTAQAA